MTSTSSSRPLSQTPARTSGAGPVAADGGPTEAESEQLPGGRYSLVLLLLITSYLVSAFLETGLVRPLIACLYAVTLWLALRTSRFGRRTSRRVRVALVIGTVLALTLAVVDNDITR